MPTAINLVCTRCPDDSHTALQRWYNDHAQLLMISDQLQGAELFRFKETTANINYFCLYQFNALSDFAAFDAGQVMEQVRDLSNTAPGRSSIEIVRRTQYERVLHRRWAAEPAGAAVQASLLTMEVDQRAQAVRWLNDAIYQLHSQQPLALAQVYVADQGNSAEFFVLIQTAGPAALKADWLNMQSPFEARPSIEVAWQSQAISIAQWLR